MGLALAVHDVSVVLIYKALHGLVPWYLTDHPALDTSAKVFLRAGGENFLEVLPAAEAWLVANRGSTFPTTAPFLWTVQLASSWSSFRGLTDTYSGRDLIWRLFIHWYCYYFYVPL